MLRRRTCIKYNDNQTQTKTNNNKQLIIKIRRGRIRIIRNMGRRIIIYIYVNKFMIRKRRTRRITILLRRRNMLRTNNMDNAQ